MNKREREAAALAETYEKAKAMYLTLVGLTSGPQEGMEMICMMHLLMFMNHGLVDINVDDMLQQYCFNFKQNYDAQLAADKQSDGTLN